MADRDKLSTSDIATQADQASQGDAVDKSGSQFQTGSRPTTQGDVPAAGDGGVGQPTQERMDARMRSDTAQNGERTTVPKSDERTALLDDDETHDLRDRWTDIQAAFVDKPKEAVSDADELVAETMKALAEGFADERTRLESAWSRGDDVSTEDLRVALQRYRSFFERLLSA